MAVTKKTVLVTGATGRQGGVVARVLLGGGHRVRAMTRKPQSPAAELLRRAGAEISEGDFNDPESLVRAMQGVDTVFGMGTPYEAGPDAEQAQGIALVDAAERAKVRHLVYTSVASADRETGIPHFESKFAVEQHLLDSGVPNTVIRPVFFAENYLSGPLLDGLRKGVLTLALPPDRSLQHVTLHDIGKLAAWVIDHREEMLDEAIDIASFECTPVEFADALSRHTGQRIRFEELSIDLVRAGSEDAARMYEWFDRVGYDVDLGALHRRFPEVGWQNLATWLDANDLSVLRPEKAAPARGR